MVVTALACLFAALAPPAEATYPGRPGLIVFSKFKNRGDRGNVTEGLFAIRPGQEHPRRLTTNSSDRSPSFSPSGNVLVFKRTLGPKPGLYLLRLRSGETERIVPGLDAGEPAFGPGGSIAFVSAGSGDILLRQPSGRTRRLTSSNRPDQNPVFTPSGKRIVFQREGTGPRYVPTAYGIRWPTLFSIRPDGTGLRALGAEAASHDFDISPSGERIVFDTRVQNPLGSEYWNQIWAQKLDGSGQRPISPDGSSPTYSPAGNRILYTEEDGLWVTGANGGGNHRLIHRAAGSLGDPAWQPLPR